MVDFVEVLIVVGDLMELLLLDFLVVGVEVLVVRVEPVLVGGSVMITVLIVRVMVIVF